MAPAGSGSVLARTHGLFLTIAWTVLLSGALAWIYIEEGAESVEKARIEARTLYELNLAYRRWATDHGGVYVPVTESLKPNPYLVIPDRDLTTTGGRRMTMINPAWMSRQVFEILGTQSADPIVNHLTSVKYINPLNRPDAWEEQCLRAFEQGGSEISAVLPIDGRPYMRLMRPFSTEAGCLKCHGGQGYKIGDVRGGISISVPMAPYYETLSRSRRNAFLVFVPIWLSGTGIIVLLTRNIMRKERAITASEKEYRLLFESNPHPMWVYDLETLAFLAVNAAAVRHYGYTREEFLGMTIKDIRPAEDIGRLLENVTRVTDGLDRAGVWRHIRKNGEVIHVEITSHTVTFGGRRAEIVLAHDITDRMKLEDQLRQAQKMEAVGRLAGGVAHDFNNILTAIIGYTGLLDMKIGEQDPLKHHVKQVVAAAERAAGLTQSLLAFSRKQIINPKPVDLNEIVRTSEKLLARLIGEDIDFRTFLDAAPLTVMADSGQIEQVLMNLATNARDAMPQGGTFTVRTAMAEADEAFGIEHPSAVPGVYAVLSLTDSGIGMDERTRQRIFEPFFTTKELGRGTGLGLSIVYGIIQQHNGHISVYSEPGDGTTFRVYLPLTTAPDGASAVPAHMPVPGGTETLLIVEDDEAARDVLKRTCETFGYRVIEAADGNEAVATFAGNRAAVGLVILDVILPKRSGREVYDAIRELKSDVRVLFLSGYTADIIHARGILDEGIDFLSKPAAPETIMRKVREILDRRS